MRDKERIMMMIISMIVPAVTYCRTKAEKEDYVSPLVLDPRQLKTGDLVMANSTLLPNEFMVGFVYAVKGDCIVIREIGSEKLCNYYNEVFSVINKKKLGYEILEGVQYQTYRKVLKAFSEYTRYSTRFRSIEFSDDTCTVTSRRIFENDKSGEISFKYNSRTKISDIGKLLEKAGL